MVPVALAARLRRSHFLFLGYAAARLEPARLPAPALGRRAAQATARGRCRTDADPLEREFWRQRGVDVFDVPLDEYVEELRVSATSSDGASRDAWPSVAVQGPRAVRRLRARRAALLRARARAGVVVANLLASRLTVLYGPSGVGKSSVLRAGVRRAPALGEAGSARGRRLRRLERRPGAALAAAVAAAADIEPRGTLADTLETCCGELARRALPGARPVRGVLPLPRARTAGHARSPSCRRPSCDRGTACERPARHPRGRARRLDAFKARVPGPVRQLPAARPSRPRRGARGDRRAARALQRARSGRSVDDRAGARRGRARRGRGGRGRARPAGAASSTATSDERGIEAPYLQLVMSGLWEAERDAGSRVLRRVDARRARGRGADRGGAPRACARSADGRARRTSRRGSSTIWSRRPARRSPIGAATWPGTPARPEAEARARARDARAERILRPVGGRTGAAALRDLPRRARRRRARVAHRPRGRARAREERERAGRATAGCSGAHVPAVLLPAMAAVTVSRSPSAARHGPRRSERMRGSWPATRWRRRRSTRSSASSSPRGRRG